MTSPSSATPMGERIIARVAAIVMSVITTVVARLILKL